MTTPFSAPLTAGSRLTPGSDRSRDWDFLKILVARWRILLVLPLVCALVGGLLTYLIPPTYTATTSFVTASQRDLTAALGNFANVASQLGVGLPSNPSNSPQFYGDVLRSRQVMEDVVRTRIPDPRATRARDSVTIGDLFIRSNTPSALRVSDAVTALTRESSVSVNPRTSIIELRVSSRYPTGAAMVARRFLAALNRFNLETRQSQARERRRFVADRLREAQDSLTRAERAQQDFLLTNRGNFRGAPTLDAQYQRIQRQIQTYQDLYSNFRREYETARVDEINDTPVITIIDTAAVPPKPSAPRRLLTVIAGAMFGIFLAITLLLIQGYLERLRLHSPRDYDQLRELRRIFLRTIGVRHADAA
jgi:uncharacterized protein involved in exopolysaccharide biosynthesis